MPGSRAWALLFALAACTPAPAATPAPAPAATPMANAPVLAERAPVPAAAPVSAPASGSPSRAVASPVPATASHDAGPLRAVVHLSDPSRAVVARGLTNVRNALQALGDEEARFVLVVHGQALGWLYRAEPENLGREAAALLATGKVEIRVCARTLEEHHWQPADLVPGVVVVPSGTLEVLRLQREGFAYFRP